MLEGHPSLVSILHISDIHRSPSAPTDNTTLLGPLLDDVRLHYPEENERKDKGQPPLIPPVVVVVSGDLTYYSLKEEYQEAAAFLTQLAKDSGIEKSKVVIVPGNHDLNFGESEKCYTRVSRAVWERRPTFEAPYREAVKKERGKDRYWQKDEASYTQRFRYFKEFLDQFYAGTSVAKYPLQREQMYTIYDFSKQFGIVIVGFNSCDETDHLDRRAFINTSAIFNAVNELSFHADNQGILKIAIFHHNIRSVGHKEDFLDPDQIALLYDHGFFLCLHGHVHKAARESFRDLRRREAPVVGAGSLAAPWLDRPASAPKEYNLIVIDVPNRYATIHTRRQEEGELVWKPFHYWLGGKSYYQVPIDIRAVPSTADILQAYTHRLANWVVTYRESMWAGRYVPLKAREIDVPMHARFLGIGERTVNKKETESPLLQFVDAYPRLLLVGDPGSGKTTSLLQLARKAAQKLGNGHSYKLPAYVPLRGWTRAEDLLTLLSKSLSAHGLALDSGILLQYLQEGRFLILLDGVNEIHSSARESGAQQDLANFVDRFSNNQIVITTRREGYDPRILELPTVEIIPLGPKGMQDFLELYLGQEEGSALYDSIGGLEEGEWRGPYSLVSLGRNPLMLWMIAEVYKTHGQMPTNRGMLFAAFSDVIFKERELGKGSQFGEFVRRKLLARLAFAMLDAGELVSVDIGQGASILAESLKVLKEQAMVSPHYNVQDILDEMRRRVFGFVYAEDFNSSLVWTHQRFQEYFAARQLYESYFDNGRLMDEKVIVNRLVSTHRDWFRVAASDWTDAMALLVGLLPTSSAVDMVNLILRYDTFAACKCYEWAPQEVRTAMKSSVLTALMQKGNSRKARVRRAVVSALGAFEEPQAIQYVTRLGVTDPDRMVRRHSRKALRGQPPDLLRSVMEILADPGEKQLIMQVLAQLNKSSSDHGTSHEY
jgi:DNA polymerase III delta prime subunit